MVKICLLQFIGVTEFVEIERNLTLYRCNLNILLAAKPGRHLIYLLLGDINDEWSKLGVILVHHTHVNYQSII